MKVDYIIVGLGLAGIAFAEKLIENNHSFVIYENGSQHSSKVAGGMFNPVILKRFTPVWQGVAQIQKAIPFYKKLESKLQEQFIQYSTIKKSFKSIEDQNNWFIASDHPQLKDYLSPKIEENNNPCVYAPHGLGQVVNTGYIKTGKLLDKYKASIKKHLIEETFLHHELTFINDHISYKNITAKQIVFCEGFGVKENPFFKHLPLKEAKGELLEIQSKQLNIDYILKSSVFIMPLSDNKYKVGATFNWKDKTNSPTEEGKQELQEKLDKCISCDYTITNQLAGIRPTVKDRRPLIGSHPEYKNIHVLNGLGTRGVMLAPTLAEKLYNAIEKKMPIEKEININRFD